MVEHAHTGMPVVLSSRRRPHQQRRNLRDLVYVGVDARNTFRADDEGRVRVAEQAPQSGDYEGIDGSGPWWSMQFADERTAPTMFTMSPDALDFVVTATTGEASSTCTVRRRWRTDSTLQELDGDGFVASCLDPRGAAPHPCVVIVPGSTGTEGVLPNAGLLAAHGYSTAVLSYMQHEGLPVSMEQIPLERRQTGRSVEGGSVLWVEHWFGHRGLRSRIDDWRLPEGAHDARFCR